MSALDEASFREEIIPEHFGTTVGAGTAALPGTLRLLCLDPLEPEWMHLTMHLDRAGCVEPRYRWVSTVAEGLTVLRDQSFDCILMNGASPDLGKEGALNCLSFARAARAAGHAEPVLLVSPALTDGEWAEYSAAGCDLLITNRRWDSPALVPMIRRLVEHQGVCRENRRLVLEEHRRLLRERDEAEQLLHQQRQLLGELAGLSQPAKESKTEGHGPIATDAAANDAIHLRREIDDRYQELLRAYVMMGSASQGQEIAELAGRITLAGMSPREALQLHVERVESLIAGLGSRSARHVLARGDLLALELMVCLGEESGRCEAPDRKPLRRVRDDGGIDLSEWRDV